MFIVTTTMVMIVNIYSGLPLGGTMMRMIVNRYSGLPLMAIRNNYNVEHCCEHA